jgi:Flp pilus assembly protein TadD
VAHYQLGQALEQTGAHGEAIAEFEKALTLLPGNATFQSNLAHAYAVSGRRDDAIKILGELRGRGGDPSSADANIALVYVGLDDNAQAMVSLNNAYQARFNPSILLRPAFDRLRVEPSFQDLVRRIGLPIRDPGTR